MALLILACTLVAWIAQTYERPAAKNLLDFYLQSPTRGIIGSAVLAYQPPLLDILPMYVIFMLATPLVMRAASCQGWRGPLCPSMAIWIAAQFGLRSTVYAALNTHLSGAAYSHCSAGGAGAVLAMGVRGAHRFGTAGDLPDRAGRPAAGW